MTSEQTLAAELSAIRADLAERRRYVRIHPIDVRDGVSAAAWVLSGAAQAMCPNLRHRGILLRLLANLQAGLAGMDACPDALDGYLAGADWELAVLIGRLEREGADAPQ